MREHKMRLYAHLSSISQHFYIYTHICLIMNVFYVKCVFARFGWFCKCNFFISLRG